MLDKLLITFDIDRITTKVMTENFNALSHVCKNTCFGISQAQVHGFLNNGQNGPFTSS